MKNNHLKFLFVLGLAGLFLTEAQAQRIGERRSEGSQRSFSPNNNQTRIQREQPQRQSNPAFSRPERNPNFSRPPQSSHPSQFNHQSPSQTQRPVRNNTPRPGITPVQAQPSQSVTPPTATQTPVGVRNNNTSRPGRIFQSNRGNQNPGGIIRPAPANVQPPMAPQANNNRNNQGSGQSYSNSRAGINPGNNTTIRRGRGGNTYVYNNYQGNNYYSHNYYNSRPKVIYNAYNPSWRYNYYPRRNTIVTSFPFAYTTINFGGYPYRYYDGLYYRPYDNIYRVVAPPFGIYINTLPLGYSRIYVRDNPYYYYNGTYYDQYQENYRVVAPPVGAIVESIPEGYETVVIDGETYYKVDDVQYKPIVQDNGEIWYEVIKVG